MGTDETTAQEAPCSVCASLPASPHGVPAQEAMPEQPEGDPAELITTRAATATLAAELHRRKHELHEARAELQRTEAERFNLAAEAARYRSERDEARALIDAEQPGVTYLAGVRQLLDERNALKAELRRLADAVDHYFTAGDEAIGDREDAMLNELQNARAALGEDGQP